MAKPRETAEVVIDVPSPKFPGDKPFRVEIALRVYKETASVEWDLKDVQVHHPDQDDFNEFLDTRDLYRVVPLLLGCNGYASYRFQIAIEPDGSRGLVRGLHIEKAREFFQLMSKELGDLIYQFRTFVENIEEDPGN